MPRTNAQRTMWAVGCFPYNTVGHAVDLLHVKALLFSDQASAQSRQKAVVKLFSGRRLNKLMATAAEEDIPSSGDFSYTCILPAKGELSIKSDFLPGGQSNYPSLFMRDPRQRSYICLDIVEVMFLFASTFRSSLKKSIQVFCMT